MGIGCTGRTPIMYLAHKPVLWVCYAFIMPMIVFGLFGNILSFQILGYNRSRRNQSSTFYLRALAIADSMTLLFNTLLMAQQMLLRPALNLHPLNFISQLVGSYPMCNLRMYASHTSTLVSVYIIVLFSIERALVVINPFRWMRFFSLRKAKIAVVSLSITCCLICIPSLFSFNKEYYSYPVRLYNVTTNATFEAPTLLVMLLNKCSDRKVAHLGIIAHLANASRSNESSFGQQASEGGKTPFDRWSLNYEGLGLECQSIPECRINFPLFKRFILFHNIALSIVPFIVTGICNIIIATSLRRRETENLGKSKANEEQQDRQVTKKLIIVSTTFIVLGFPLALFHIVTLAMSGSYCKTFWANAMTITICLNAVNYAINFIIYCISEEQFRKLVVSVLLCKRHRLKRLLSYINEPRNKRHGGGARGAKSGTGAGASTGGGRKNSNQLTNVTNYSISQTKDVSDQLPVTDALVHQQHTPRQHEPEVDEAACSFEDEAEAEMANMLEEAAADYVVARHSRRLDDPVENPHDFKNCSYIKDDYASELFSDEVEDARLRAIMARWSEISPE